MKYTIRNRWTMAAQCEVEIECSADVSDGVQLGLAVRAAIKRDAYLSGANLRDANLSGANLSGANLSGAYLSGAYLRDAYLSGANLRDANLSGANLRGAYLSGAYLSDANLSGANLRGAYLSGAYLSGANLRDANLSGAPVCLRIPNIHSAVFAAASADGALNMNEWHKGGDFCGTTHCRAGWVVHLAGPAGHALDWAMGTPAAAAIIYMVSDPKLDKIPDFYCDNETALADMKRLADLEVARTQGE